MREAFDHRDVGFMHNPNMGNRILPGKWWAADNGCFSSDTEKRKQGVFNWEKFKRWFTSLDDETLSRCLFAVVPDMPFDGDETIKRFHEWKTKMRTLGVPLAFVTQDGMGAEDVPWGDIDALFVGGSTEWKTGNESAALIAEAKRRRKWVHMGRVNSLQKLRTAASLGCDSADGTFLKYGPDKNWLRVKHWMDSLRLMPPMHLPGIG